MKEKNVLFQIKSLDKMIYRSFLKGENLESINSEKNNLHPTPTQMQIVEYILKHSDEEVYQKDLENVLKLRRATVSGVLQTMEKNGLIERVTSLKDTRTKKIILNENTKKVFLKNKKKLDELEKVVLTNISTNDLKTFSKVLTIMKENIEQYNINI